MAVYYNEIDPFAAAWLRELIKAGEIADGVVDERSIVDVRPDDLRGFAQCHFFAGIGGWSLALRLAGWPDDRPVWTGSCPCQPFSRAGSERAFDDARDLWPQWFRLISECRPRSVFGEQVTGRAADAWLQRLHDDMESAGYFLAAADLPACSVGAPHIRSRTFFGASRWPDVRRDEDGEIICEWCEWPVMAGCEHYHGEMQCRECGEWTYPFHHDIPGDGCFWCGSEALGYAFSERGRSGKSEGNHAANAVPSGPWLDSRIVRTLGGGLRAAPHLDGSLVDGVHASVGRVLKGYGNAIVPQVAAAFVGAYLDAAQPSE